MRHTKYSGAVAAAKALADCQSDCLTYRSPREAIVVRKTF